MTLYSRIQTIEEKNAMEVYELHQCIKVTDIHSCNHISRVTSELVWVSYYNTLNLTNTKGERQHHLEDLKYGFGLHTVNSESELIYISNNNAIKKLSKDMTKITTVIERRDMKWEPLCVYWSSTTNDLLVGMYKIHTATGNITRYNQTLTRIQTIQYDEQGLEMLKKPIYIAENNNGDVLVSDNMRALVVTTREGRHRFSYTGYPPGSGLSPCGICTDVMSHILICDEMTNTLQILNEDGQFLRYLLKKTEVNEILHSLNYDVKTHFLWVGTDFNNTLCIYRDITQRDALTGKSK